MAVFTAEQIEEHASKVVEALEDGFQLSDLSVIVPLVMEVTDAVDGMSGEDKHATAEAMIDYVLENTDAWGWDAIVDPIAGAILKGLIPVIAKLTKGEFAIN